jgi:hypothetical protein
MNDVKYSNEREALWQRLVVAGVASGELPPAAPTQGPWYVRTMLGIAGWIGALFLLGFVGVGLAFVFRDASAAVAVGLICCVSAYAIFRAARHNDFVSQFGLALSFAGQVLFVYGLAQWFRADGAGLALWVAAFEVLLAVALANAVHRAWCTFAAAVALAYALAQLGLFGITTALVAAALAAIWLHETLWAERGELWAPVGYGLALSLVTTEAIPLLGHGIHWMGQGAAAPLVPWWIGYLLTGAVLMYAVYRLLDTNRITASSRIGALTLVGVAAIVLITRDAAGIIEALLVMLLGYAAGARVLLGIGVIALLAWLSHYYYSLQATLLAKSGVLAASGAVLIALWVGIRLLFSRQTAQGASDA